MSERKEGSQLLIGVISDTHGLLRPEAVDVLQGSDYIVHAGDIGRSIILDELRSIAPVVAVRGNMDGGWWAYQLPVADVLEANKILIYVIHDISKIDLDPKTSNIKVVVSGHTHSPSIENHNGVLYLNPGSAGPRRSRRPVSVALIKITGKSAKAELITLKV
jgi:putative phosphoesterase